MKTILHLSDLHFSDDDFHECFEVEYQKFKNTIQQMNIKIDYVFLTGDMITFNCLENGYKYLKIFLNRLKQLLNLQNDNIIYVSGNHEDLSREDTRQNELFFDFINQNCNKKSLKSFFSFKIEGFNFVFFNSYVNKYDGIWDMNVSYDDKLKIKEKDIIVLHANPKYYRNMNISCNNIIYGHKLQEFCCNPINDVTKGFNIAISSLDGFCSGNYIAGIYTVKSNTNILCCRSCIFEK